MSTQLTEDPAEHDATQRPDRAVPALGFARERAFWFLPSGLALIVLLALIVAPLGYLAVDALTKPDGDGFTLSNFAQAFGEARLLEAILNSARLGLTVTVLCTLIGVPMAWLVARTDLPGAGVLRSAAYVSFVLPALLTAVSWVMLASPNAGLLNRWMDSLFGVKPLDAFSLNFLAVIIAFSMFSYTFQFTLSSFDNIGGEIEEAAAISGASPMTRTIKIVIPLAAPAIMSSMIVVFLQTIALYGAPALIAVPAGEQVITTQLFSFFSYPQRPQIAAAYSVPMIVFAAVLIWARRRIMGRKGYATISGKAGRSHKVSLGRWRWLIGTIVWAFYAIAVVLPAGMLIYIALLKNWAIPGFEFSLDNFKWAFNEGLLAVQNSVIFAFWTGTLCASLGLVVAYLAERRGNALNRLLGFLSTAPLVVPGMILAIGMLAAYSNPPILLYGTSLILIAAFWARFLPIALQNLQPAVSQVNEELEQAARISGAGFVKTMFRITLPLVKGAFISAWIFSFVLSTHEISASMLLVNTDTQIMPTLVTSLYEEGRYGQIAALGVVMVSITMAAVVIGRILANRSHSQWKA